MIDPLIRAAERAKRAGQPYQVDREIAEQVGCSRSLIARRRRDLFGRRHARPDFARTIHRLNAPLVIRRRTLLGLGFSGATTRTLLSHWTALGLLTPVGATSSRRYVVRPVADGTLPPPPVLPPVDDDAP